MSGRDDSDQAKEAFTEDDIERLTREMLEGHGMHERSTVEEQPSTPDATPSTPDYEGPSRRKGTSAEWERDADKCVASASKQVGDAQARRLRVELDLLKDRVRGGGLTGHDALLMIEAISRELIAKYPR